MNKMPMYIDSEHDEQRSAYDYCHCADCEKKRDNKLDNERFERRK
mgnify:CR=1 FL=1